MSERLETKRCIKAQYKYSLFPFLSYLQFCVIDAFSTYRLLFSPVHNCSCLVGVSRSHGCQIFKVLTHYSCSQVSALPKGQGTYQVQASLSHLPLNVSLYTRSSSVVTISRPPTSLSLKITNRSFQHTAPRLWNKLPHSFREPHPHPGLSPFHHLHTSDPHCHHQHFYYQSLLLFYSRLKTHFFLKSFPP